MFPTGAYGSKFDGVIDAMSPIFMAFAGALLTIALIVAGTKLGWGSAISGARGRFEAYHNIIDVFIAITGVSCLPIFIGMLLQLDGALLASFATYMQNVKVTGASGNSVSLMSVALQLGMDDASLKALTDGSILGSSFAAVIFVIIYIFTAVGLAIWVKYYYFMRMVAFIILMILGPVFIGLWPFGWGKSRTIAWLKDVIGTIFIQPIQAFTLTIMATLIAVNANAIGTIGNNSQAVSDAKKATASSALNSSANSFTSGFKAASYVDGAKVNDDLLAASNFEVMVVGFIVLILFQPVSRAIAELFGISTNMLDKIHQSTSRTIMTGAAIGGAAVGGLALGAAHLSAAGVKGAGTLAGKAGEKLAEKNKHKQNKLAGNLADKLKGLQKNTSGIKAKEELAKANALLGPNAGRLIGAAAGAGAGNTMAMIGASAAGGEIGKRAALLAPSALSKLGLKEADPYREQMQAQANETTTAGNNSLLESERRKDVNPGEMQEGMKNLSKSELDEVKANAATNQAQLNGLDKDKKVNEARLQELAKKDASGNYISNADTQSKQNETIKNHLKNGEEWDAEHGTPTTLAEIRQKADEIGFDGAKFEKDWSNSEQGKKLTGATREAALVKAENQAMSGFADRVQAANETAAATAGAATTDVMANVDGNQVAQKVDQAEQAFTKQQAEQFDGTPEEFANYMDQPEMQEQLSQVKEAARKDAYIHAGRGVLRHTSQANNDAFVNSTINGDQYQEALSSNLDGMYVPKETQNEMLNNVADLSGERMTHSVNVGDGSNAQVLDNNLYNRMNQQAAYTMNNAGGGTGRKVTAGDLAAVYKPSFMSGSKDTFGTPQEYADHFAQLGQQSYDRYNQQQQNWAHLMDVTQETMQGGAMSRLGRMAGLGSSRPYSPQRTADIATARMHDNPYREATGANSLSLAQASELLPRERDNNGEVAGVAPGSFQKVTTNTHSYLRVKDRQNGVYRTVGMWGVGDGSLAGGEEAYQDLDLTPSGDVVVRQDPMTHRPTGAYRMEGSNRVPITLTNQSNDFGQYFGGKLGASSVLSSQTAEPNSISPYLHIANAPELKSALNGDGDGRVYGDQYNNQGYTDVQLVGRSDGLTIVGNDPRDNVRKVLCEPIKNTVWPGMGQGYEFQAPLKWSNGEYVVDDSKEPVLSPFEGFFADQSKMDGLRNDMHDNIIGHSDQVNHDINHKLLLPTRVDQKNFQINNRPMMPISGLDTMTK